MQYDKEVFGVDLFISPKTQIKISKLTHKVSLFVLNKIKFELEEARSMNKKIENAENVEEKNIDCKCSIRINFGIVCRHQLLNIKGEVPLNLINKRGHLFPITSDNKNVNNKQNKKISSSIKKKEFEEVEIEKEREVEEDRKKKLKDNKKNEVQRDDEKNKANKKSIEEAEEDDEAAQENDSEAEEEMSEKNSSHLNVVKRNIIKKLYKIEDFK